MIAADSGYCASIVIVAVNVILESVHIMIPVCEPNISESDILAVTACMREGRLAGGPYVQEFEEEWAKICNRKFGIAVANGTVALELAIDAIGLQPGDEVIIPTFTIISCALAVVRAGATPVFVDVDDTWCIDPTKVATAINDRTRAIMAVHMYGQPADMDAINDLANKYNLAIIEDAAQAHGATYKQRPCGSFGKLSCFSFYANKIITTGEGGMIMVDDEKEAEDLRYKRNLCFGAGRARFIHRDFGHNYRLTDIQAAIGRNQLYRFHEILENKCRIGMYYRHLLKDHPEIVLQRQLPFTGPVYWMNGVTLPRFDAAVMAELLQERGIETRPFFTGLHSQPCFTKASYCPKAEELTRCGLYLPSSPNLTEGQVYHICEQLKLILTA
jgi:perosamine synthetase